jgi:hypothetical protein
MAGLPSLSRVILGFVLLLGLEVAGKSLDKSPVEAGTNGWDFSVTQAGVSFKWKKPSSDGSIDMELSVDHLGWAGFGFCTDKRSSRGMRNCDMVAVWVNATTTFACVS